MRFKALVSAVAMSAALAVSGPAFSQSMINGVEIPEEELADVQARCDELQVASETESLTEEDSDADSADSSDDTAGEADATIEEAPEVDEAANATGTIDLDTIDLQACIDAGLVTE